LRVSHVSSCVYTREVGGGVSVRVGV